MEIPYYRNLELFKSNYGIDYEKVKEQFNTFQYFTELRNNYTNKVKELEDKEVIIKEEIEVLKGKRDLLRGLQVGRGRYNSKEESFFESEFYKNEYPKIIKEINDIQVVILDKNNEIEVCNSYRRNYEIILNFLHRKINKILKKTHLNSEIKTVSPESVNLNPAEIPELEETPEEKDAKVKFILLKELGIIDFLISQNYSNADIGKILLPITQIKKSYTENILTADFKFPDTTKDKTAYKEKNILKALDEIEKMGISFKQLKYLPQLKSESPKLFEKGIMFNKKGKK